MIKKVLISLLAISLVANVIAQQQIIFNNTNTESFLVKYSSSDGNSVKNQLIKKIAEATPKPLHHTKFTFTYTQKAKIFRKQNKIEFLVELQDINLDGDVFYKGFSMEKPLFPHKMNYKLQWLKNNGQLINTFTFTDVELKGNVITIAEFDEIDSTSNQNYKVKLVNKQFIYDQKNKNKFNKRANLIDEYYASDVRMNMAHEQLHTINIDNVEMIHQYNTIIEQNRILIDELQSKDFSQKLKLNTYDPISFEQKFSDLHQFNAEMKQKINYVLENLHEIYYHRGLEFLVNGNAQMAEISFQKSINSNLFYAPSHYQLAKINYNRKDLVTATNMSRDILNNMNPDPQTRELAKELVSNIINDYLNEARYYNENGKYDNALEVLGNLSNVCNSISGFNCGDNVRNQYSAAINGKYNRYLTRIYDAINSDNLAEAENLINTTKIFINNNPTYITNRKGYEDQIGNFYNAYVLKATESSDKREYEKALTEFDKAKQICNTHYFVECSDVMNNGIYEAKYGVYSNKLISAKEAACKNDLDLAEQRYTAAKNYQLSNNLEVNPLADNVISGIKLDRYRSYILKGYDLTETRKYKTALQFYEKAKKLEGEYTFEKDENLGAYINQSAKAFVLALIGDGKQKVEINNLSSARSFYKNAKDLKDKYRLDTDSEIAEAMDSLKNSIFSQECRNAQQKYDNKFNEVMNYIAEKKFIQADMAISSALDIAKENEVCDISTNNVNDKRSEVLPAITYQKLIVDVEQLIYKGNYQEAIEKYKASEKYFYEFNVKSFGISHIEELDYFKKTKSRFVNFAVNYYTLNKKYENALALLNVLEQRDYSKGATKENQTRLGSELATRDFKNSPSENPKKLVVTYTKGSKWLKYMKKGYVKQWKRLK